MTGLSPVASTSCLVAANRARETERPDRLFEDVYAAPLAGEGGFALQAESRKYRPPGSTDDSDAYISIRTRFFDDTILRAVSDPGRRQVVLLAAGMDARAFRLAWPDGVTVYELDRDDVFSHKEAILHGLGASPACARRVVVRADLEKDWMGPLRQAGFDERRPSAFLAEGLAVYLAPESVEALLANLSRAARAGSWLGLDVVNPEMLTSPYVTPFLAMFERFGCPWRFATPDPERLLARHGWAATVAQPSDSDVHHGRWPYPPPPPDMPGLPRSFFVTARRLDD